VSTISSSLRERLLGQKAAMARGGITIDNKTFVKDRLRLIPLAGRVSIGVANTGIYVPSLKKGSTSPATYGLVCPIVTAIENIRSTGSKEDLQFARDFANVQTEYWTPVIARKDMGTAAAPKIRILKAKSTVFETLLTWMTDEDIGEDITAVKDGRDFILKKTGVLKDTKWTCEKYDREPLSEDEDYNNEVLRLAAVFDPSKHFFPIDLDILKQTYENLTGDVMPASLSDPIEEFLASRSAASNESPARIAPKAAPGKAAPKAGPARIAPKAAPKPAEEEQPADDDNTTQAATDEPPFAQGSDDDAVEQDVNFPVGARVIWTEGETQIKGVVVGMDQDPAYAGCILVRQEGEPVETAPWSLPAADLTIEEVTPVVSRRRPPAKSAAEIASENAKAEAAAKAEQAKAEPAKAPAGKIAKPASTSIRDRLAKK
jgi:hypothetical protein